MCDKTNIINFGAGPAKLPEVVLQDVQKNLVNYRNTGISIMETFHRSAGYLNIYNGAIQSVKDIL